MNKSVIITGANSFIGQKLVLEFLNEKYEVLALVHSKDPFTKNEEYIRHIKTKNLIVEPFELTTLNKISFRKDVTGKPYGGVIHLGWQGAVGEDRKDAEMQCRNVQWTIQCIKQAIANKCECFMGMGSIQELEILKAFKTGQTIDNSYNYALGKYSAHRFCELIASAHSIRFLWPILTNTYGAGEEKARFLNVAIKKLMNGQNMDVSEGKQNYDFIYIDDVVRALRLLFEKGKNKKEYIVGSGSPRPLRDYLSELEKTEGIIGRFCYGKHLFSGVFLPLEAYSTHNLQEDTGFRISISTKDGYRRMIEWSKEKKNNGQV